MTLAGWRPFKIKNNLLNDGYFQVFDGRRGRLSYLSILYVQILKDMVNRTLILMVFISGSLLTGCSTSKKTSKDAVSTPQKQHLRRWRGRQ
jgi:hypothetical protein